MAACVDTSFTTFLSQSCSRLWLIYIHTLAYVAACACVRVVLLTTSPLCSPKTDHLKFHNPTVCMYEHAPGQAWESPRSLIVHTSLSKKKQFSFFFYLIVRNVMNEVWWEIRNTRLWLDMELWFMTRVSLSIKKIADNYQHFRRILLKLRRRRLQCVHCGDFISTSNTMLNQSLH